MSELRLLLGPVMFARLCDLAGGTRVHVPKHYGVPPHGGRDTRQRMGRLFGESLALLLIFHFGGGAIHVPLPSGHNGFDRTKLKRLVKRKDLSSNEVARRVGCTRRTVENYRSRNNQAQELRA